MLAAKSFGRRTVKLVSFREYDAATAPIGAGHAPRSADVSRSAHESRSAKPAGKRPRIAINGRFLCQSVTGVQRVCRAVVREIDRLLDHEFDAEVALIHPSGADPRSLDLRNIRSEAVGRGHGAKWEQLTLPFAVGDRPLLCLGNIAPGLSLLGGKRVSVMVHDFSYLDFPNAYRARYRWSHRLMLPLLLSRAERLFVVSWTERERLLQLKPGAEARVVVAPNGGWLTADEPGPPVAPPPDLAPGYLLYVGSLSRRKNFDRLLEAAIRLAREDGLTFVFTGSVGNILHRPRLDVPPELADRLIFTGQIDEPARLASLYKGARLLVFPSLYEASPLPPFEAAHFGCPVVASNIPAMWERCDEGVTYCDPESTDSIVAAVRQTLADDAERARRHAINAARERDASWTEQARTILTAMLGSA
jgi:glycosyltransferase involved in cell wall biosynthesis